MSVFRFIAKRKAEHSVKTLCRVLGVSVAPASMLGSVGRPRTVTSPTHGWALRSARSTLRAATPTAPAASTPRLLTAAFASAASGSSG